MKVEKINLITQDNILELGTKLPIQRTKLSDSIKDTVEISNKPSFTGATSAVLNTTEQLIKNLPNHKLIRFFEKAKWLNGEKGGIIITAAGTGAIAPTFIAYNPLMKAPKGSSKEEQKNVEDTKKYTALRQPVSAALAILFQFGALKPIDKVLDIMFNKPEYAKNMWLPLDQSSLNNTDYLKKLVKKEMQEEKITNLTKKQFKAEVERRATIKGAEQISKTAEVLENTGRIQVGNRFVDNKSVAEIINEQIEEYITDAQKLKKSDEGLKFYTKRATSLIENETHLKNILTQRPNNVKELTEYLKKHASEANNPELKEILNEFIKYPAGLKDSRCQRTLERIENIKKACDGKFTPEKYLDEMISTNTEVDKVIKNLSSCKIAKIDETTPDAIKTTIENISKHCTYSQENKALDRAFHDTETFKSSIKEIGKKIYKDVTTGYKKVIGGKYKGFNQCAKIAVGLFITLPITCTALNWLYPRVMEICFPKLAGAKKAQADKKNGGGKECQK